MTTAKLVGVADYLPQILSHYLFMKEQGFPIKNSMILQDNKLAILLEINSWHSYSKRIQYINIYYFYIKDLIEQGEVKIDYCPTERMLADFFSKPLQGNLFWKFRDVVLGHKPLSTLYQPKTSSGPNERVG